VLLRLLESHIARLDVGMSSALVQAAQVLLLRVAGSTGVRVAVGAGVLSQGIDKAAGVGLRPCSLLLRVCIGRLGGGIKHGRCGGAIG